MGSTIVNHVPQELLLSHDFVAIEKTTAGLTNISAEGVLPPFPVIGVANCAAKRVLESPLIAQAVVTKLENLGLLNIAEGKQECGVVGYGAVGKAVADKLVSLGHRVVVYDNDPKQLQTTAKDVLTTDSLTALVANTDYIFGCTGRDISTQLDNFRLSKDNKTLISCSSEDVEFLSLLKEVQRLENGKVAKAPLKDVIYKTQKNASIRIVRGGFPANFDDTGESVPAKDIDLTRSLVLGALFQAVNMFKDPELLKKDGIYALSADIQHFIASQWLKSQVGRYSLGTTASFKHPKWIQSHSGGIQTVVPAMDIFKEGSYSAHASALKKHSLFAVFDALKPDKPTPRKFSSTAKRL